MSLITIYDSGVGGLSIYKSIIEVCPEHEFVFISDNQAFPYGTKSESELAERVSQVVSRIDEHCAPDILVLACNTASTVMLPSLRANFDFEIVGVVPAIKPAATLSKTRHIGLLATPATVERAYTDELIAKFTKGCRVTKLGSSELVALAEQKLTVGAINMDQIATIIEPFVNDKSIDTLVLACTHFPLLSKEIESIFEINSRDVLLVHSGAGIAKRVSTILTSGEHLLGAVDERVATAIFTQKLDQPLLFETLDKMGFSSIEVLAI